MHQFPEAGLRATLLHDPTGADVIFEITARSRPTHVLDAIVDTTRKQDPLPGLIADGKLFGRCVADSMAAAAVSIELGREFSNRTDQMRRKTILFVDGAEHTSEFQGVRALLAHNNPTLDGGSVGYPATTSSTSTAAASSASSSRPPCPSPATPAPSLPRSLLIRDERELWASAMETGVGEATGADPSQPMSPSPSTRFRGRRRRIAAPCTRW